MLTKLLLCVCVLLSAGCATAHSQKLTQVTTAIELPENIVLESLKPTVLFSHMRSEENDRLVSIIKPMLYVIVPDWCGDEKKMQE